MSWVAGGYIAHVGDTVNQSAPSRWTVEPDRIVLGFFSFNKLLMYLDLGHPSVTHNDAAQIRERQQQLRILPREIQKQKPALPL